MEKGSCAQRQVPVIVTGDEQSVFPTRGIPLTFGMGAKLLPRRHFGPTGTRGLALDKSEDSVKGIVAQLPRSNRRIDIQSTGF
jgi:hypothetical protein